MGWSSGSELMSRIIPIIEIGVDDMEDRVKVYKGLIEAFEAFDCDSLNDCLQESLCFDVAYNSMYPEEE